MTVENETTAMEGVAGIRGPRPGLKELPRSVSIAGLRVVVLVVVLALWELIGVTELVNSFWISRPSAVGRTLLEWFVNGSLVRHALTTFYEALVGLVIGAVGGIAVGLVLARWSLLDEVFEPYLAVINSVPRIALTPLFIIWFGIAALSKVMLVITLVFFVLLMNTLAGAKSVDPDIVTVARLVGATPRGLVQKVVLPSLVPWIFAGLRLSLAYAIGGAVVGEMIAAQAGLGYLISYHAGILNISAVFAAIVAVMILSFVSDWLLRRLERRLLRWRPSGQVGSM